MHLPADPILQERERTNVILRISFAAPLILAALLLWPISPAAAQTSQQPEWKSFNGPQFGQLPTGTPSWVYYEEGQRYFDQGQFGQALVSFRRAIELQPEKTFPEAELGIGLVYEHEGESALAITHLSTAISQRKLFYIPQDYYSALYALAEIDSRAKDYRGYENALVSIVEEDRQFSDPTLAVSRPAYRRTLENDGLDKLVLLYRLPDDFSLVAHMDLGIFYVRTGNYSDAADHLMFSTLKIISTAITGVLEIDPNYQFTTMVDLLDRVAASRSVESYIQDRKLFENLYYLAAALYGQNFVDRASEIWELVASRPDAGTWASRANSRLRHPTLEPLLNTGN